jgi:serine protease AprX
MRSVSVEEKEMRVNSGSDNFISLLTEVQRFAIAQPLSVVDNKRMTVHAKRPVLRTAAALLVSIALGTTSLLSPAANARTAATRFTEGRKHSYIVRTAAASRGDIATALHDVGATVGVQFHIINAVQANLTDQQVESLRQNPAIASVTIDAKLQPMAIGPLGYDLRDPGSTHSTAFKIGAMKLWRMGITGRGVDVAVIDTGVNPVEGLIGRVVDSPDISLDAPVLSAQMKSRDLNGHGTHMAGIIAGRDSDVTGDYARSTGFVGIAPDARIVNVKVGAESGAVDVTQVISGLEWIVRNKNANGLNIKVVNLSYGSPSTLSYWEDPLAAAAEAVWRSGIVVVAAAGNDGAASAVTSPASNPNIIAVGAADRKQGVTTFSNSGGIRNPDLWAPGSSIISLSASPTSNVERLLNPVHAGSRFIRGTGTSQATAAVSGAVALLAQAYPTATPDQLRIAMIRSNSNNPNKIGQLGGVGEMGSFVNLDRAIKLVPVSTEADSLIRDFVAKFNAPAGPRGTGSLDGARGANLIRSSAGAMLTGNVDWMGNTWSGNTWSGNTWSGNGWSGNTWSGNTWSANSWSGNTWSGNTWSGNSWSANSWSGGVWAGSGWN